MVRIKIICSIDKCDFIYQKVGKPFVSGSLFDSKYSVYSRIICSSGKEQRITYPARADLTVACGAVVLII